MKRPFSIPVLFGIAAGLLFAQVGPASGQPFWIPREGKQAILFERLGPSIEGTDQSFLSAAYYLSGRFTVSDGIAVVGELPYAHFKSKTEVIGLGTFEVSSSTIGNPYLGMEVGSSGMPIFGELGVSIPLSDRDEEEAWSLGLLADLKRWNAFLPKAAFVDAAFNVREVTDSKIEYRLRFAPELLIPTDSDLYDTELFATYAWAIGYHGSFLRFGTALSGRILFTEDSNLGEQSINQFEAHADIGDWSIRPGLDLHLPLDTWGTDVPVVLGFSVSWCPPSSEE
jgi:hypothetical protein